MGSTLKRLSLAAFFCCSIPALATWSNPNSKAAVDLSTSGTTISAPAFSNALTNPSIITVFCLYLTTDTPGSPPVTDTAGNTYVDSGAGKVQYNASPANAFSIFYAINIHTTASNIVTCHGTATNTTHMIRATEFAGGTTGSALDGVVRIATQTQGSGGANVLVSPTVTTSQNGDLILGFFEPYDVALSAGTSPNSFTNAIPSFAHGITEYFVQTSAGAIAPTAGYTSGTNHWGAISLAFSVNAIPISSVCGTSSQTGSSTHGVDNQFAYTKCGVPTTTTFVSECINVVSYTATASIQLGVWANDGTNGTAGTLVCNGANTLLTTTGAQCLAFTVPSSSCVLSTGIYYLGEEVHGANAVIGAATGFPSHNGGNQFNSSPITNFSGATIDCFGCDTYNTLYLTAAPANRTGILPPMMR